MGSKNNPPKYNCYQNAEPDEEMFILLGRDPMAGTLVRLWAQMREHDGSITADKADEARACANRLDDWAVKLGKEKRVYQAKHTMVECVSEFHLVDLVDASNRHVDRFVDDHKQNAYARLVLMYMRFPAAWQLDFRQYLGLLNLFCTHEGTRYRVTMASRLGHIGLSTEFDKENGYSKTASPYQCSEWSAGP